MAWPCDREESLGCREASHKSAGVKGVNSGSDPSSATSCVISDKLLSLPGPQFLYLKTVVIMMKPTSEGC